jgi:agmatinase
MDFDPNSAAAPGSGIYGLPHKEKDAAVVFLPVPWEATVSYHSGTAKGPKAILEASAQLDLYDPDVESPYRAGMFMLKESAEVARMAKKARRLAQAAVKAGGGEASPRAAKEVDALGARLNDWVREESGRLLDAGKIVGLVGGDHSTPYGAIVAAAERHPGMGVLHFDAHLDMRDAYQGFRWSHASILRNVIDGAPGLGRVVQVGIRDYCGEELEYVRARGEQVRVHFDAELARARFAGKPWAKTAEEIVAALPEEVWVTFDIDGLDPRFCPGTGTPVPGGLDYLEAVFLLGALARSGRRIVGFDLNEVAPGPQGEWDANVAMRLLYKLSAFALATQGRASFR